MDARGVRGSVDFAVITIREDQPRGGPEAAAGGARARRCAAGMAANLRALVAELGPWNRSAPSERWAPSPTPRFTATAPGASGSGRLPGVTPPGGSPSSPPAHRLER